MPLIIQFWGDRPNPMKYPAGYPADSMTIKDGDPIPEGWTEVSDAAYKIAVEKYRDEVITINKLAEEQQNAKEIFVEAEVKSEIETLQVHKETADSGGVTPTDREVAIDTMVSLLLKYAPILEQIRKTQVDVSPVQSAEAALEP